MASLTNPWRPLATCLKMTNLGEILNFELWAPYTYWHAVLKRDVDLRQKAKSRTDYCPAMIARMMGVFASLMCQ